MSEQKIVDKCPSCGSTGTLFIGEGGYLTCSLIGCPQPGVTQAIAQLRAELAQAHEEMMRISVNLNEEIDKAQEAVESARKVIEQVKRDGDMFDHLRGFAGYIKAANYLVGED